MEDETSINAGARAPEHFIVELRDGDRVGYALCERILLVEGDGEVAGVPKELLDKLFANNPLRAVPLQPTARGGHFLARTMRGQSGVNININVNSNP